MVACMVCDANKPPGVKCTDGPTWCEHCARNTRSRSIASRNERIRSKSAMTFAEQASLFGDAMDEA